VPRRPYPNDKEFALFSFLNRAQWKDDSYCPVMIPASKRSAQCLYEHDNIKFCSPLCEMCPEFIEINGNSFRGVRFKKLDFVKKNHKIRKKTKTAETLKLQVIKRRETMRKKKLASMDDIFQAVKSI
jgi:hypothetical protein